MAYSAEESSPPIEFCDNCYICNEDFYSAEELTDHLIDHASEEKFQKLLAELPTQNGETNQTPNVSIRATRSTGPEFIKTAFVKEPPVRKKPDPAPTEPEVWEIVSDDEEPNEKQGSNSKKPKLSNSFRLVTPGADATNNKTAETGPPFHCHSCTSVFSDAVSFREHLSTHEKPRPYVCHICKKSFAYKGTLRQHLHLHISDRSHECRICHKKFTIKSVLRKHEESHDLQHLQEQRNNT